MLWAAPDGLGDELDALGQLTRLIGNHTRQMQAIKVPGLSLQYLFINELGLTELTLLVKRQSLLKPRLLLW